MVCLVAPGFSCSALQDLLRPGIVSAVVAGLHLGHHFLIGVVLPGQGNVLLMGEDVLHLLDIHGGANSSGGL